MVILREKNIPHIYVHCGGLVSYDEARNPTFAFFKFD